MVVLVRDDERADFEDLLGSGGIFRKMLHSNADGAQVGACVVSPCDSHTLMSTSRSSLSLSLSLHAEFGEEVTIRYSEKVLESNVTVTSEETRKFRIGDGEAMPGTQHH